MNASPPLITAAATGSASAHPRRSEALSPPDNGFAQMLRSAAPAPAPAARTAPPPPPVRSAAPAAPHQNTAPENRTAQNAAPKPPSRPATVPAAPQEAKASSAAASKPQSAEATATDGAHGEDSAGKSGERDKDDATAPDSPLAREVLAQLGGETARARPEPRADGDTATPQGDATGGRKTSAIGDAGDDSATQRTGERQARAAADDAGATRGTQRADADKATHEGAAAASGTAASEQATPAAKGAGEAAPGSFQAQLAQATQAQQPATHAHGAANTPQRELQMAHPLHSDQFAPEVAASLSLLIKDGIQQAQLQLNPPEMGPVAVQIQLDGTLAQVNFVADQAQTRDALERGLPELAAALQGQGLTLSGGGVFGQNAGGQAREQAGTQERSAAGATGPSGAADPGAQALSAPLPRARPRGVLDLYA